MPYIDAKNRPQLDTLMDPIIDHIKSAPLEERDGMLDYVVTRMLKSLYQPPFFNLNRAMGVLTAIMLEYYRVVVAPYEDEKIRQFGQVEGQEKPGQPKAA